VVVVVMAILIKKPVSQSHYKPLRQAWIGLKGWRSCMPPLQAARRSTISPANAVAKGFG
jgi:hypothetical protein